MTYDVPFRLDLVKTEWNPDADPYKWVQKIFTIVKNCDKTAALISDRDENGNWRRFKELSDVPKGRNLGPQINKKKQHRKAIQTLFGRSKKNL